MIGWLSGTLREVGHGEFVVVDRSGVGWAVNLTGAAEPGAAVEGPVSTIWRESSGPEFWLHDTVDTKAMFDALCAVRQVGPSVAAAALRGFGAAGLAAVLTNGDVDAFKPVRGVGPKMAERLIAEVKIPETVEPDPEMIVVGDELAGALTELGFAEDAAVTALTAVRERLGEGGSEEEILAAAIQELSGV